MAKHTVLAVVTLPEDVFYPVGVTTAGLFLHKGIPHPQGQNVLWVRALSDGYLKRKRKRLPHHRASNDLESVRTLVKAFIRDPEFPVAPLDQFQRAAPIDLDDKDLELVPEAFLAQSAPVEGAIQAALENSIRNTFAYLVKIDSADMACRSGMSHPLPPPPPPISWKTFVAEDIFTIQRGHFHSIADLEPGDYVTISRVGEDNGFVGFYDIPAGASEWPSGTVTVSTVTGDAFAQPVPFIATDNVVMLNPKPPYNGFTPESLTFAAQMLNRVKWRYSYGRQCYQRRFAKTEFTMPVGPDGTLDYGYMESIVKTVAYWPFVRDAFAKD